MKSVLFFAILLSVAACASNAGGYTSAKDVQIRLNQLSEVEVASKLGAPTEKALLSNGDVVWTYRDKSGGLTGGECTVSLVLKHGKVISSNVIARDRSWVSFPLGACTNVLGNLD